MIRQPFDRNKHIYHNEAFVELGSAKQVMP